MLFEPVRIGTIDLPNRIVMAPMTRCRAGRPGDVPTPLMAKYYAQRATAGLIVSEGCPVSPTAPGYLWTPGLHAEPQVEGWKTVTQAVHDAGGRIFAQLWHCGRISHPSLLPAGNTPVGPTVARANAQCFGHDESGNPAYLPCGEPHAASGAELGGIVRDFAHAAENALAAGFDGVEVHGANGYLLDQFLNGTLNTRTDGYGGSIAGRARLPLEIIDATIAAVGAARVGLRLSPHSSFNDMPPDPEADAMALHLATELGRRGIACLHVVDPAFNGHDDDGRLLRAVRERLGRPVIVCGGMDRDRAERYLGEGLADLVAFGRPFISNPDLPARLERGAALTPPDEATIYGGDEKGYTDYPALEG